SASLPRSRSGTRCLIVLWLMKGRPIALGHSAPGNLFPPSPADAVRFHALQGLVLPEVPDVQRQALDAIRLLRQGEGQDRHGFHSRLPVSRLAMRRASAWIEANFPRADR